jgi:hypothetical protein
MICPFCQYERVNEDIAPDWECPRCQKVYSKYNKVKEEGKKFKFSYGELKDSLPGVITVFTLVLIWELYNIYTLANFGTIELCAGKGTSCVDFSFKDSPIGFIVVFSFHFYISVACFRLLYKRLFKM